MWSQRLSISALVVATTDRVAHAVTGQAATAPAPDWWTAALTSARGYAATLQGLTAEGFHHAPAIMLGLALAAGVPVLAVAGWLLAPRVQRRVETTPEHAPACEARVRVAGAEPFRIAQDLVSIGRGDDNDVQLSDAAVEDVHALISCTPERDYVIVDVSAGKTRRLFVNGKPVVEHRLRDGDRIDIGQQQLIFEARLIAA